MCASDNNHVCLNRTIIGLKVTQIKNLKDFTAEFESNYYRIESKCIVATGTRKARFESNYYGIERRRDNSLYLSDDSLNRTIIGLKE